jgi:hypothetical protein
VQVYCQNKRALQKRQRERGERPLSAGPSVPQTATAPLAPGRWDYASSSSASFDFDLPESRRSSRSRFGSSGSSGSSGFPLAPTAGAQQQQLYGHSAAPSSAAGSVYHPYPPYPSSNPSPDPLYGWPASTTSSGVAATSYRYRRQSRSGRASSSARSSWDSHYSSHATRSPPTTDDSSPPSEFIPNRAASPPHSYPAFRPILPPQARQIQSTYRSRPFSAAGEPGVGRPRATTAPTTTPLSLPPLHHALSRATLDADRPILPPVHLSRYEQHRPQQGGATVGLGLETLLSGMTDLPAPHSNPVSPTSLPSSRQAAGPFLGIGGVRATRPRLRSMSDPLARALDAEGPLPPLRARRGQEGAEDEQQQQPRHPFW